MSAHELDDAPTCKRCLFVDYSNTHVVFNSDGQREPAAICRRLPPQSLEDGVTGWPMVNGEVDWCGEFINSDPESRVGYQEPHET